MQFKVLIKPMHDDGVNVFIRTVILIAIICLLLPTQTTEASTFIRPVSTHPGHPGKCWHKETHTAIKPGHIINIPYQCIQIFCTKDLRIAGAGCSPDETLDVDCRKVDGNRRLTYPACCPTFECDYPEDNTIESV